ncbi:glycosyltransferase family 4 protein [Thermosynechococcaceae cyanobacterium Okahandja]
MGGAERVTANLANYWVHKGWSVCVATLTDAETDFYKLDADIIRVSLNTAVESPTYFLKIRNNLRTLFAVRQLLREYQPDIAIGMMTGASVYLALASRSLPVHCIGSERTHPPICPPSKDWELVRTFSYGYLNAVVALTEKSANWLRGNTNARFVPVIPNPVVWPLPIQPPIRNPAELMREDRKICLAVGRLSIEKGFDLLLAAFSEITHSCPEWDLVIVGKGELYNELQRQIYRMGLQERAYLAGQVGNISDWYKAADLFVLSSRFEGFPNVLAEALASGLPAICFDCETGPSDIIRHEIDGILVPNQDVAALTRNMKKLMTDENMRKKLSSRAVEARQRFSIQKITQMWEEVFEQIT